VTTEFVRLDGVTKDFSGVKALDGVALTAHSGEVLALVGENGAGKSTLMNILSGVYPSGSYQGQILVQGKPVHFQSPLDAEHSGITIIHQELSSFPHLTVAENMWVGHWPKRHGLVDWQLMESSAAEWLEKVGAPFAPEMLMGELSTGGQQLVEIAKALSRDSRLLILDEPTSSLTPNEVERLFKLLKQLRSQGKALIYISHKMEEIYELADRITVLRDGKSVHSALASELTEPDLISHMVGRSLERLFPPPPERPASFMAEAPVLAVQSLIAQAKGADGGGRKIGPLSFELRKGEILGFAGLLGSGRSELMQALVGGLTTRFDVSGEIRVGGELARYSTPRQALRAGLALVSEDRKRESNLPVRSLLENVSISRLATGSLTKVLNLEDELKACLESLDRFRTRYRDADQAITELSGGNQQKIIIGRILQTSPDVIILDEPTRGVDVGAKYEIYQILFELAAAGKSLLVVSSDLPELMALSDRIMVLAEGHMMGELPREKFSQTEIMRLAVSGRGH
jgi:D-xylose transport system ATP-binding protein